MNQKEHCSRNYQVPKEKVQVNVVLVYIQLIELPKL